MRSFYLGILFIPFLTWAQPLPTIEEKTAGLKKEEGFFTFYREEAGGKVTRLDGGPFQLAEPNLLATNGSNIHQELITHLA